jgi:signal transduction histidine kinase
VWAIADAHGGRVSARNLPERGAEFSATLPGSLRISTEKVLA